MFFKFKLAQLSLEAIRGINESARKKGYPEVFVGNNLNPVYRFVVHPDHVGTVWSWSPFGMKVDKVMFFYMPNNEEKVWFFTDGRIS